MLPETIVSAGEKNEITAVDKAVIKAPKTTSLFIR